MSKRTELVIMLNEQGTITVKLWSRILGVSPETLVVRALSLYFQIEQARRKVLAHGIEPKVALLDTKGGKIKIVAKIPFPH